ncbi:MULTISPECIES: universal stress protein [Streptomyces]|uniref:universal stress protein n=1 Tax=Streptomyces TaxID=1883 RepID=UPI0034028542
MLPPVVAAVDGSAESLAAAEWAAHEAVRRERPLQLLHAWNWHPRQGDGEIANAAQRQLARRVLRQAELRVLATCPDVRLHDAQAEGPATAALLKAAEQADVLVLGSRGLSGITGFLVGSVALRVVAGATRPVVLVRAVPRPRSGHGDVVLGIDLGEPCDDVVEFGFAAARRSRARLRAVHAWQAPGPLALGPGDIGLEDAQWRAQEWLGVLSAVLRLWHDKYPDVELLETVVEGRPSQVLTRAASGAGLLVVGRRISERPLVRRTGPVTHAAIQHVDCPVAVVPHF